MKVKIDFRLGHQFGAVEGIIFQLVIHGFHDIAEIMDALPLFSDSVIANAIRHLVNKQILSVDLDSSTISLSEAMIAIIGSCLSRSFDLNLPQPMAGTIESGSIVITEPKDKTKYKTYEQLKRCILQELLPNVKLDMFINSLDYILHVQEQGDQQNG